MAITRLIRFLLAVFIMVQLMIQGNWLVLIASVLYLGSYLGKGVINE